MKKKTLTNYHRDTVGSRLLECFGKEKTIKKASNVGRFDLLTICLGSHKNVKTFLECFNTFGMIKICIKSNLGPLGE